MPAALSTTALGQLIELGPDPESTHVRLERYHEQGGRDPDDSEGRVLLSTLLASGRFLPDILLSDPMLFTVLRKDPWLRDPKPREIIRTEVDSATRGAKDLADLQRRLRVVRRYEMLRLGAREISYGTSLEVGRELSGFADACLEASVAFCDAALRAGYGEPKSSETPPAFVVMGMGKLGGEELNFSSDIDLIFVYSTDEGSAGSLTLHEYYSRLAQRVTRALGDITDHGLVFRVDLRLRPEGSSGAICNSLAAAESYYETFGRTWERQALLRARPCAGDLDLGARYLRTLEPFIHPRTASPRTMDEVRSLRHMYRESVQSDGFNVKLGAGGIRDVELVAQLLQLLHAGKRRELRERGTLPALHKLALAGLLTDQEVRSLGTAYRFWRRVEHCLQLEHAVQTHQLPEESPARQVVARRLDFADVASFDQVVLAHREAVSAISDTLGEPESGPSTLVLRLLDSAFPRAHIEADLRSAGFHDPSASADALQLVAGRLPPEWLEEAICSPDPDRALGQFRDLSLRASLGVFALLKERPPLLRMLASLFGTSERLSRHLVSHPSLWVPLFDSLGDPRPDPTLWQTALNRRLAGLDYEEALHDLRRFQSEEIVRIGLHDVAGNLNSDEVSAQLVFLAELSLGATLDLVARPLVAAAGQPDTSLSVLALGSFGAREMRYGSDLDLVFLYGRPGTTSRGMDHQEWFARFAQRAISALTSLLDEGRLYDVDTRLRPSGAQGTLVTSYSAFDHHHHEKAAPWERVALLRARPVYTWAPAPDDHTKDFSSLLEEIAYRPIDETALRSELQSMRERIQTERANDRREAVHLRFSSGCLTDLEFLAAWGQLRGGQDDPGLRTSSPYEALVRMAIRGEIPLSLLEHYRYLKRASLRLRLLRDQPDDRLVPADRPALARSLETTEDELVRQLEARRAQIRSAFIAGLEQG